MSRASDRKKLERQLYYQRYPSYFFDVASCAGTSEQFAAAVQQAAGKVRFDAREAGLKVGNLACLRTFKKYGYAGVRQALGDASDDMIAQVLHLTAGEALIRVLDERDPMILDRFAPFSTVIVQPSVNSFHIIVFEMTSRATRLGHAFLHERSTLAWCWNDQKCRMAFSRHALLRFRDRLYPHGSWRNYGALGDLFAMFSGNMEIRQVAARRDDTGADELLLAMYFYCSPGLFHISPIPEHVLDGIDRAANDCFVLVGYAPCARDGDLLVVKTLLSPGMRGTPEERIMDGNLDMARRMEMEQTLNNLFDYRIPLRCDHLHWLHEHGAAQVVIRPRT